MMGADQLPLHGPRWPLDVFTVGPFGRYGAKRTNEKEGACGTKGYPCTHWGADLMAPKGTNVYVPFTGWMLYHGPADKPPFVGYGPWVALIAHADKEVSLFSRIWDRLTGPLLNPHGVDITHPGLVDLTDLPDAAVSLRYTLIGHLDGPASIEQTGEIEHWSILPDFTKQAKPQALVKDIWGASKPKGQKDHWQPLKDAPENVVMFTGADAYNVPSRAVTAGQLLGHVSDKNHVHWELRTSPIQPAKSIKGIPWRIDPIATFHNSYGLPSIGGAGETYGPVQEGPSEGRSGGGGGAGLALLALAMFSGKKRRGARRR